jgi:uncharacterized protein YfaT (DUF1175 family)
MTDAPETIWRWAVQNCGGFIEYSDFPVISEHSTKYTRADVAQARIAELEAALSATDKALRVYGAKPDFYRAASHQAQETLKAKP